MTTGLKELIEENRNTKRGLAQLAEESSPIFEDSSDSENNSINLEIKSVDELKDSLEMLAERGDLMVDVEMKCELKIRW